LLTLTLALSLAACVSAPDVPGNGNGATPSDAPTQNETPSTDPTPGEPGADDAAAIAAIAERYIEYMREGTYMRHLDFFKTGDAGSPNGLDEKLWLGATVEWDVVLNHHRQLVIDRFGEGAWDNAGFYITEIYGAERVDRWLESDTGRLLTEEEMIAVRDTSGYGYTPVGVPTAQRTWLRLTFFGEGEAPTGEYDFCLQLGDKGGAWHIESGLSWSVPFADGDGD
jgi:hypothetical protein